MAIAMDHSTVVDLEEGANNVAIVTAISKPPSRHCCPVRRTSGKMSATSLRRKSEASLTLTKSPLLACIQHVVLRTRLFFLIPAVPLAVIANYFKFGDAWVFALSLAGLVPLAERLSFLTEQISMHTGKTAGGLLNATCGNAPELIISVFALRKNKPKLVQRSLAGSVLSNLLLVLGSSLLVGGVTHLHQQFDRQPADACSALLLLSLVCQLLPLASSSSAAALSLSRICSIAMLLAYVAYLFFQLKTHRQLFESPDNHSRNSNQEGDNEDEQEQEEEPVLGYWGGLAWLAGVTAVVSLLSEYIVGTIEEAAGSWKLSVGFISVILLPIVGNAAEHAGAIIFAYKNKLDITISVSMGSATQISMLVLPVSVISAWIMGVNMGLNFENLEVVSMVGAVIVTAFVIQDGTSHYLKGVVLILCYLAIGTSFFVQKDPSKPVGMISLSSNHAVVTGVAAE